MTKFHSGARVVCPTCKTRTFIQDQPWKRVCLDCYLHAKGKTTPTARTVTTVEPIEPGMLRRLIQLCHPDKHANSEASNTAPRFLLALKGGNMGKATGQRFASVWDALPVDLLGDAMLTPKRTNSKPEAAALCEVLKALRAHPAVVWCERMNTGAASVGGRFIRFGFTGCPDVIGQLRDGRFLGCEVKAPKGRLRPEQAVMLERINGAGGVAFVARDLRDVHRELNCVNR